MGLGDEENGKRLIKGKTFQYMSPFQENLKHLLLEDQRILLRGDPKPHPSHNQAPHKKQYGYT